LANKLSLTELNFALPIFENDLPRVAAHYKANKIIMLLSWRYRSTGALWNSAITLVSL